MKKAILFVLFSVLILNCCGCGAKESTKTHAPARTYTLDTVHPVDGRQGVCVEGDCYWVSGSTTLTKYDRNWNKITENTDPFKGYALEVNHIGDIDVYQNELYLGDRKSVV